MVISTIDISSAKTLSTGTLTLRTLGDRSAEVVNVMDFGAVADPGDFSTDSSAAINAAIAYIRTLPTWFGNIKRPTLTGPTGITFSVKSTINLTGFTTQGLIISNLTLRGATTGEPIIDCFGSRWLNFDRVYVHGAAGASAPNIGIQVGRISASSADQHTFDYCTVDGTYTFAAVYNLASEVNQWNYPFIENANSGAGAYALVMDGYNHFGITSQFVTQTLTPDAGESFGNNTFINGTIASPNGGVPIWMSDNTFRHKYINTYHIATGHVIELYGKTTVGGIQHTTNLTMQLHSESIPADIFLLTGPRTNPSILGLTIEEPNLQATNSIFKCDTGIVSASISEFDLRIGQLIHTGVKLFDNGALWTLDGTLYFPTNFTWIEPLKFSGTRSIGTTRNENFQDLPGADPHVVGRVWSNSGVLTVSAG